MPTANHTQGTENTNKLECPCCNNLREQQEVQVLLEQFYVKKSRDLQTKEITIEFDWLCSLLKNGVVQWACDNCLKKGRAIVSDPGKMNYSVMPRYFAYFDKTVKCYKCKKDFIFSTEEQQHWFETLRFWHESYPDACPTCRKNIRRPKALNTELSKLILNLDKENPDQLQRIAEIYEELGITEKAKHYNTLAKKRRSKQ